MYSKGRMTGVMPGEVKMEHDFIEGMLASDPDAMKMPANKIEEKRAEINEQLVGEIAK
jgi:hypothetical protein